MIPLKVHNILDYVIGAVLVLCPLVFGFSDLAAARNTFYVLGLGLIAYSLMTRYYYSAIKLIPLGVHMTLDVLAGLVLIAAPSLFNYRASLTGGQHALHWILGLGAIGLVALTNRKTESVAINQPERRHLRRVA